MEIRATLEAATDGCECNASLFPGPLNISKVYRGVYDGDFVLQNNVVYDALTSNGNGYK